MAQGVERFFKAAIVDRNPSIASAALVSAYHLYPHAKDVVKRWVNEAQEAVNAKSSSSFFTANAGGGILGFGGSSGQPSGPQTISSTSYIAQYHALGLLYLIRQQDRMAVTKMIQQLGGGKSGAGTTLKVKYVLSVALAPVPVVRPVPHHAGGTSSDCIVCASGHFTFNSTCVLANSNGVCQGSGLIADNKKRNVMVSRGVKFCSLLTCN